MRAFETLIDQLIDQERPLAVLDGIFRKGDVPHAFLFTGMDGVGKRTAARYFAMACNCAAIRRRKDGASGGSSSISGICPCGECPACSRILAGSHPDLITIEPDGDFIKIARIRELLHRITFKPSEADMRAVIIAHAGTMNREASNALLKALEEPPPQTVFFLTAAHPSDLLSTVVSRCQHVRFNPVSAEAMETFLQAHAGATAETARTAALLAGGSMAAALSLVDKTWEARKMADRRHWLVRSLVALPRLPVPMVLAFAEALAGDKKALMPCLDMIKSCLRDAVVMKDCPADLINADMTDNIRQITETGSRAVLVARLDAVMAAEAGLQRNANVRLLMENMALTLAGRIYEKNS
ncbi:MAG: DNA polymerase III subunit delta' [Thermodesulfobacteriota bacterium]|nr:DNA polymerase III subunit delta' [Thermodesulfobacteriota bacterium]